MTHEKTTTSPQKIEITNNPESFMAIIEESAKKLGLETFQVSFDVEVARTEDPDGTQHITVKPVALTKVPSLAGHSGDSVLLLKPLLKPESFYAYAVRSKAWGGNIYGDGDQTQYTNIAIYRITEESTIKHLKDFLVLAQPHFSYNYEQNWVAGAERDYVESETSVLNVGSTPSGGRNIFEEEILSRLDRVAPQTPTTWSGRIHVSDFLRLTAFRDKTIRRMEREEIIRRTRNLPASHPERIAEDHEIWEGDEEGAHFKIARNFVPQAPYLKFYVLSVSGETSGREKIISDFISAFGEPNSQYQVPGLPHIYFLSWDAGKVDANLKS